MLFTRIRPFALSLPIYDLAVRRSNNSLAIAWSLAANLILTVMLPIIALAIGLGVLGFIGQSILVGVIGSLAGGIFIAIVCETTSTGYNKWNQTDWLFASLDKRISRSMGDWSSYEFDRALASAYEKGAGVRDLRRAARAFVLSRQEIEQIQALEKTEQTDLATEHLNTVAQNAYHSLQDWTRWSKLKKRQEKKIRRRVQKLAYARNLAKTEAEIMAELTSPQLKTHTMSR